MKLLIGYDGSDCAKAAVKDLVLAGLPRDVDALLLSVADLLIKVPYEGQPLPDTAEGRPASGLVRTARALAEAAMNDARQSSLEGVELVTSLFPGWAVRSEVVADSPYWALIKKADQWTPDLLVVGSHGRSALGRLFMGSVSQNVLTHAACSVRVARTRERPDAAPPRIIIGVDGSEHAAAAVEAVIKRDWPEGTQARVLTAVDPQLSMAIAYDIAFADSPSTAGGSDDGVLFAARHNADAIVRRLFQAGVSASALVERANPKHHLVEEARQWNADCIFVGAKGHSRLERFLLGSVSTAVAARAHCTVEIVRP